MYIIGFVQKNKEGNIDYEKLNIHSFYIKTSNRIEIKNIKETK